MSDLNGLADDINLQLTKDQDNIDKANENMEEAKDNMSDAQKELLKKREKLIKKMKRVAACFICLMIFLVVLLITIL